MATARLPYRGGLTCACVVETLPVVEELMVAAGLLRHSVDVWQFGYRTDVAASAGTHSGGGCTDVSAAQSTDRHLAIWRAVGWTMQLRTVGQGFGVAHGHGWPYGCPHLAPGARYQSSEWAARRNGLRSRGPVLGPGWHTNPWPEALAAVRPQPKGDPLDMALWRRFVRLDDQKLTPGRWQYLRLDETGRISFASGPAAIVGGWLNVQVRGLPVGRSLLLRVVQDDVAADRSLRARTGPVVEIVGSTGTTHGHIPISINLGSADDGFRRRARLIVSAPVAGVEILRTELAYWKADR